MIFVYQTKLSCSEIENRIEEDAKHFGLMMKKHFPFSKNLPENGFEIKEHASVFELCKASVAANLLNTQPELNVEITPVDIEDSNESKDTIKDIQNDAAALAEAQEKSKASDKKSRLDKLAENSKTC